MRNVTIQALLLLAIVCSAVSASAEETLCDASSADCRTSLIRLINNERQGIDVGVWFFKDSRFTTALINAKTRGVPIRIIMDPRANAQYAANGPLLDKLSVAGIPMRKRIAGDICHWKLMIFAGQGVVEWSGANFSPTAFVPVTPYQNYEDEVIYFSEQLVPSFMTMFDNIWTDTRDYANYANVPATLVRNYPTAPIDQRLNFPPKDSYQDRLIPLIDREPAGGWIDVDMYRITLARPVDALIRAASRGVRIRMYLELNEYNNTARPGNKVQMDRLVAAAQQYPGTIEIRMRKHAGLNHQKTIWLHAQHIVAFGTSNWSDASDDNQLEANIFTDKVPGDPLNDFLFTELRKVFERKWNNLAPDGSIETVAWRTPTLPPPVEPTTCRDSSATNFGGPLPCTYPRPPPPPPPPPPGATTIVVYPAKGVITGTGWQFASDATAAGGAALWNPNANKAKVSPALAAPASYVEKAFDAMTGTAYHVWVRLRAEGDSLSNDSLHIQFSDSVTSTGAATQRIGTSSSAEFILQDGPNHSVDSAWGWADNGWGVPGSLIYFAASGAHTLRIQAREDGPFIDQIVLSPDSYITNAPGPRFNDGTILAETGTSTPPPSCTLTLSSSGGSYGSDGASDAVSVTASVPFCSWTASSNADWVPITGSTPGAGAGTVGFAVATNTGPARVAEIAIGSQTFAVSQTEAPSISTCSFTLSPTNVNYPSDGGSGSFAVTASDASCAWSATSTATSWLSVDSAGASGTGGGTVSYTVAANAGGARSAAIEAGGQAFAVTQDAPAPQNGGSCGTVTLDGTSKTVGGKEANWVTAVTAPDGTCAWTATSDASWLVVKLTTPTAMPVAGSGTVKLRAVINDTGVSRTGHVTINGVVYTVKQLAG